MAHDNDGQNPLLKKLQTLIRQKARSLTTATSSMAAKPPVENASIQGQ